MFRNLYVKTCGAADSRCRQHKKMQSAYWRWAPRLLVLFLLIGSLEEVRASIEESAFGYIFRVEDLIVKPAEARKGQFIFLNVAFEVKKRKNLKDLRKRNMDLRSGIKSLIRSKTIRQLDSPNDKKRLRNEIYRLVESHLTNGDLIDVYFVDYIIQTAR